MHSKGATIEYKRLKNLSIIEPHVVSLDPDFCLYLDWNAETIVRVCLPQHDCQLVAIESLQPGTGVGSVIKKRRKRMAKKKHRKLLRKTRVQRRRLGK